MTVAVIGSRTIKAPDIAKPLHPDCTRIVSGGAIGVDQAAAKYARGSFLDLVEIRPNYAKYGRQAPLMRNHLIVDAAQMVLAFWDGKSKGTKYTIDYARRSGKPVTVVECRCS